MKVKGAIINLLLWMLLACPLSALAQSQEKGWHETKNISSNFKAISSQPDLEVFSAPYVIMLKVNKPTEVRTFTILGKLISSEHLDPGIYEFRMETHGIYIIKTDQYSFKLAI